MSGKDLGIAAGIAVTSFLAGGLISKFLGGGSKIEEPTAKSSVKQNYKGVRNADNYVSENSLREPAILKELREFTKANVPRALMLSDPVECQFFRMLLNMLNAKKCIEIGTFTGYNALSCALTIPFDGVVYALDINEDYVKHGYEFFEKANVKDKIIVKIAPALETLDQLIADGQRETFDFIYLDADKLSYEKYLDRAHVLLRIGGIAAIDNTLQGGNVMRLDDVDVPEHKRRDASAIHKINKGLKLDNRFQLSFLNIADGVTLCRKI